MAWVRRAELSDAKRLAELAEETFRATFGAANTAADLATYCRNSYGEALQAREIVDPNRITLLCEEQGALLGFAQLRWTSTPSCVHAERAGEIQRFYVSEAWQGKGIARELMTASLKAMEQNEFDVVWLGVWEHNPRAIAFYRKFGFVEVGEHVFQLGEDAQRDIVMARRVRDDHACGA